MAKARQAERTVFFIPLATFSISLAQSQPEQVRQCVPRSLAAPMWTWSASLAESQAWQADPASQQPAAVHLPLATGAAPVEPALIPSQLAGEPSLAQPARAAACAEVAGTSYRRQPVLPARVPDCARPKLGELVVSSPAWHVQLLRLLFQLVLSPGLAAYPVRSLAAHTQLPVAIVQQVVHSLAAQGYWLADAPLGTSPLLLPTPAHYWLAHYAGTLRRRLNAQRYRPRYPTILADWSPHDLPTGCLWGGATAAQRLLGHSEAPTSLTLYSHLPRPQLVQQLGLVPATKGPIEILNTFAPLTYYAPTDPQCVPPLLVYADLLASQKPADEVLAP